MSRITARGASIASRSPCSSPTAGVATVLHQHRSQILLWAVLALALNVLVGYAGLVSLGHAGLFAVAGYSTALLLDAGHNH